MNSRPVVVAILAEAEAPALQLLDLVDIELDLVAILAEAEAPALLGHDDQGKLDRSLRSSPKRKLRRY